MEEVKESIPESRTSLKKKEQSKSTVRYSEALNKTTQQNKTIESPGCEKDIR